MEILPLVGNSDMCAVNHVESGDVFRIAHYADIKNIVAVKVIIRQIHTEIKVQRIHICVKLGQCRITLVGIVKTKAAPSV